VSGLVIGGLAGCGPSKDKSATKPPAKASAPPESSPSPQSGTATNPKVTVLKKTTGVDLCPLLTAADVKQITGLPSRLQRFDPTTCIYRASAGVAYGTDLNINEASDVTASETPDAVFELGGNTGLKYQKDATECTVKVFTQPWNKSAEPAGEGLSITVSGIGPASVDRCAIGMKVLKLMFDRLPAS
jgi:hypothetical protein